MRNGGCHARLEADAGGVVARRTSDGDSPDAGVRDSSYREPKRVWVMTLNMYLGADIYPVFTALKHPPLLPGVVARVWGQFLGTNIDERVEAMARLIRVARPDLIGLQEAVLVRTQAPSAPTPASRVAYDFRDLLLAALTKSRLDYRPVAQSENLDIELPADLDGIPTDIRVTDRDVILARGDVEIGEITKRNYRHSVSLPGSVSLLRGFVAVDAIVRGNAYRFVSTHLEPGMFAPPTENIGVEQVNELIGALDELDRKKPLPVFVVGDFNSQATYGDAYLRITRAG